MADSLTFNRWQNNIQCLSGCRPPECGLLDMEVRQVRLDFRCSLFTTFPMDDGVIGFFVRTQTRTGEAPTSGLPPNVTVAGSYSLHRVDTHERGWSMNEFYSDPCPVDIAPDPEVECSISGSVTRQRINFYDDAAYVGEEITVTIGSNLSGDEKPPGDWEDPEVPEYYGPCTYVVITRVVTRGPVSSGGSTSIEITSDTTTETIASSPTLPYLVYTSTETELTEPYSQTDFITQCFTKAGSVSLPEEWTPGSCFMSGGGAPIGWASTGFSSSDLAIAVGQGRFHISPTTVARDTASRWEIEYDILSHNGLNGTLDGEGSDLWLGPGSGDFDDESWYTEWGDKMVPPTPDFSEESSWYSTIGPANVRYICYPGAPPHVSGSFPIWPPPEDE